MEESTANLITAASIYFGRRDICEKNKIASSSTIEEMVTTRNREEQDAQARHLRLLKFRLHPRRDTAMPLRKRLQL